MIRQLAAALATQVAAQLGVPPQAAAERLTQAFTQALSASGQGPPPRTNAERAAALATSFGRMAEIAARVTNGDPGPSIRSIAGTSLDADTAGAEPTPKPNSDGSPPQVQGAPAVAASPATPLVASPNPTSIPIPGPSDGRTVALAPAQAIATGGDALLGRILARAWLAGENRADAPAARAVRTEDGKPDVPAGEPSKTVDAFLDAFATALARADAPRPDSSHGAQAPPDPAVAALPALPNAAPASSAAPSPAQLPFAIPVAHDAAPVTPPAPASNLPLAPQVDPHAVVEQVLRAMAIHTADGASTVRLRLVPEHLGDVSVKLVVSGGSVDATLTAHSADAQNALAGGQSQLAKTLADAGLKLQSFSVGLAGGGSASAGDQSDRKRFTAPSSVRRIGGVAAADDGDDAIDPGLLAMPTFAPPVFAPSGGAGALNYLV